ncbi:glycosyltransferase family protein [Taibaiella soli]|uniref:Glycosyltransferase family 1 protein n=1 Tax=Taibaiella soli TaxID=1649169 RepID=A0A2W2B4F1_9BACT|nr:hypothetical protein [Taibaiella soli]PZF71017.1 hypothetical protein DN068_20145 [Taibaiella soli]
MTHNKAALIEIDGSHDECLYSQLLFLKRGNYHVTLICSENLRKQVADFGIADEVLFFPFDHQSHLQKLKLLWKIRNHIAGNQIGTVVLNSLHGRTIRDFTMLPFPKKTVFAGTLHGINKLKGSLTQRIMSTRVRRQFLLNDYLVDNLKLVPNHGIRFKSYYSIFFPEFAGAPAIEKPKDQCWIAIPGQVENKRRDYETLIRTFAALAEKPNYRFLLLGNSKHKHANGDELKALAKELDVERYFIFWDSFVDNALFHAYLKVCDIVAPLIHPGNDGFMKYKIYQISGAYNMAFAYKKPLLMLEDFKEYQDFQENAVFYSLEHFSNVLQHLPEAIEKLKPQMYQQPKWSLEAQTESYLRFIN